MAQKRQSIDHNKKRQNNTHQQTPKAHTKTMEYKSTPTNNIETKHEQQQKHIKQQQKQAQTAKQKKNNNNHRQQKQKNKTIKPKSDKIQQTQPNK